MPMILIRRCVATAAENLMMDKMMPECGKGVVVVRVMGARRGAAVEISRVTMIKEKETPTKFIIPAKTPPLFSSLFYPLSFCLVPSLIGVLFVRTIDIKCLVCMMKNDVFLTG